jgi:hypothetical protein
VLAGGGGIIVIALAAVLMISSRAQTEQTSTTTAGASPTPTPTPTPGWLQRCADGAFECVPQLDASRDVAPGLQASHYACRARPDASHSLDCVARPTRLSQMGIKLEGPPARETDARSVFEIDVYGSVGARGGARPGHAQDAWRLETEAYGAAVSAAFARYPAVERQLQGWIAGQDGQCRRFATLEAHDTVAGYQVRCNPVGAISVGNSAADTVTTWEGQISIRAPLS